MRIADRISRAKRDEWKKSIENLSRDPLTPDAKEYVSELRLWYKNDMEIKDEIEKLNEKVEQNTCEFRCELEEIKLRLHTIVESLGQPPIDQPVEFARLPSKSVNVPTPPEQSHAQKEGFSAGPTTNPEPQIS